MYDSFYIPEGEEDRKIGRSPVLSLGYFPLCSLLRTMRMKSRFSSLEKGAPFDFSVYDCFCFLLFSRSVSPEFLAGLSDTSGPVLLEDYDFSSQEILDFLDYAGQNQEEFLKVLQAGVQGFTCLPGPDPFCLCRGNAFPKTPPVIFTKEGLPCWMGTFEEQAKWVPKHVVETGLAGSVSLSKQKDGTACELLPVDAGTVTDSEIHQLAALAFEDWKTVKDGQDRVRFRYAEIIRDHEQDSKSRLIVYCITEAALFLQGEFLLPVEEELPEPELFKVLISSENLPVSLYDDKMFTILETDDPDLEVLQAIEYFENARHLQERFKDSAEAAQSADFELTATQKNGLFVMDCALFLLEKLFDTVILENRFTLEEINSFHQDFKIFHDGNNWLNVSQDSPLLAFLAEKYNLPLRSAYLNKTKVNKIMKAKLL